jgi:hypothetical protein
MTAYSFKKRFVMPIRFGLGLIMKDDKGNWLACEGVIEPGGRIAVPFDPEKHLDPEARPKRQTIRAVGKRRHARPGEIIQLYCGMRTQHCFKIGEARCTEVHDIELTYSKIELDRGHGFDWKEIRTLDGLNEFARGDGFQDWSEMQQFWREEHGDEFLKRPFKGVLIKWEQIR